MTIQALLFDMGNVIIEISFIKMMKAFGIEYQTEREAAAVIESWPFHDQYERGKISSDQFRQALSQKLGRDLNKSEFQIAWSSIYVGEVQGIESLLSELKKKYLLYLLSNTNLTHMTYARKNFSALQHFKKQFVSYELDARKPEPKIYEHVVKEIGVSAENILFFDDMPSNVEGARRFGLKAECALHSVQDIARGIEKFI